jgi:LAGLIDADG DNA endonuclease family
MCDGSKNKGGGLILTTNSFSEKEVDLLVSALQSNFGLVCRKIIARNSKRNTVAWRIYISGRSDNLTKLITLVIPHMHVSMNYKLGL